MAIITQIRNRLGPIIVIVIGLALGIFVLETALNSNSNLLRGDKDVVGVINGEKIRYAQFASLVDQQVNNYKMQTSQTNVDENTMNALRQQAWDQLVSTQINDEEYSSLGLTVSQDELKDMFFGNNPIPEIKQAFTNPQTGVFDPMAVKNYVDNLDQTSDKEQPGERRARWVTFEKAAIEQRLQTKFQNLVKGGLYIPKWLVQADYDNQNARADIKFVSVPFTTIQDSSIKVTDDEMLNYLNKNQERFKQEESRKVEYVIFPVKPSQDDTINTSKQIDDIYAKLAAAPNDTNIIKLNADNGLDKIYYTKDQIPSPFVKDTLFTVAVGSLIGPYFENNAYKIVKLMDRRQVPDSVKARRIVVAVQPGTDSLPARKKIDSIYAAYRAGTSFDSLAARFSDDNNTKQKGGDLGTLNQSQVVLIPSLFKFLFLGGTQGESRIIKSEYGYELVEISELKNIQPAVQIDFVTRTLEASTNTDQAVFDQATKFAASNSTQEAFDKSAEEQHLNKQVAPTVQKSSYQMAGLNNARELVKWAFTAKVGDVSQVFPIDNNYVVGLLTGIQKAGTMNFEDAKPQLEIAVRKEKKGEQIASALAAAGSLNVTIESISQKENQPLRTSPNVVFANSYAENLGFEPKVVGTVFGIKENTISKPVIGEAGVYIVNVNSLTKAQPIADYSATRLQEMNSLAPRLQYGLAEALKKSIKIEDNRYLFF